MREMNNNEMKLNKINKNENIYRYIYFSNTRKDVKTTKTHNQQIEWVLCFVVCFFLVFAFFHIISFPTDEMADRKKERAHNDNLPKMKNMRAKLCLLNIRPIYLMNSLRQCQKIEQ